MLDMKRVGAVITFNDNTPDWNTTPYVEHKLREAYPIHVMFHDTPRGRELRDWFDKRMRELVHSGEIRELFDETMLRRSYLYRSLPASPNEPLQRLSSKVLLTPRFITHQRHGVG